jgi:hypothetical protein
MAIIKPNNNTLSSITALPAAISTGKVLQVVSSTFNDVTAMSSSTYADITGSSLSITPSSASNKILVFYSLQFRLRTDNATTGNGFIRILRGATEITETRNEMLDSKRSPAPMVISHLDSPSTTSAVTYKAQQKMTLGTQVVVNDGGVDSYITLMEISG